MVNISLFLPEDENIIAELQPEELAGPLLAALRGLREPFAENDAIKLPENLYPKRRSEILFILGEAFAYLKRECLVVPHPPELHHYANKEIVRYRVSKSGKSLNLEDNLKSYRQSNLLPKEILHPKLAAHSLPLFIRGDYETAVFRAMKEVEIAVREASNLPSSIIGVNLMRQAYKEENLLGKNFEIDSERQALSDLFSGAIGYFRNITGHRNVEFKPEEAAQIIIFASHLLNIVQQRIDTQKENNAT